MATSTRQPLVRYLEVQRAADRDVLRALTAADAAVTAHLRRLQGRAGVGAAVRRDQLTLTRAALHRELAVVWARVGDVVQAHREAAIAAGVEASWTGAALRTVMPRSEERELLRSAQLTAESGVRAVEARLGGAQLPLSERVYRTGAVASGRIDALINDALARGASAAELSRDVRSFVNPNTPGGLRYASMRLARTELNNAFHAAQVYEAQQDPWITAVRWHLSGSHPRPDECNDYAARVNTINGEQGEPGMWDKNAVPAKPHPQCLCYLTTETLNDDAFAESVLRSARGVNRVSALRDALHG